MVRLKVLALLQLLSLPFHPSAHLSGSSRPAACRGFPEGTPAWACHPRPSMRSLVPPGFRGRGLVEDPPHVGGDITVVLNVVAPLMVLCQELVLPPLLMERKRVVSGESTLSLFPTIRQSTIGEFPTNFLQ